MRGTRAFSIAALLFIAVLQAHAATERPIVIINPAGGEVYAPGTTQTIMLDPKTRAKTILVEISRDGGVNFDPVGTIDNTQKAKALRNRLDWTPNLPASSEAVLRATSTDPRKPGNGVSNLFSIADVLDPDPSGLFVLKAGDTMTGDLTLAEGPTQDLHAATKKYVDDSDSGKVSKSGDSMTGALTLPGAPTLDLHAATKKYVDDAAAGKVSRSGDTMTGDLTLAGAPTQDLHAATKKYVDDGLATKLNTSGGTMTGNLTLLGAPTLDLHPATKKYVDDADASKVSKAGDAMTGALTLSGTPTQDLHATTKKYVDNGLAGVDLTSGGTITGNLTVDGNLGITGTVTIPTTTRYYSISHSAFLANIDMNAANATNVVVWDNKTSATVGIAAPPILFAPVNLPHGATVTEFQMTVENDVGKDITVVLAKNSLSTGTMTIIQTLTSPSNSGTTPVTGSALSEVVDNSANSYLVKASVGAGAELKVISARIKYTVTSPAP